MAKRLKITEYRERLDRTLASQKLTNEECLKSLVENQILQASGQDTEGCGEKVIQKRTAEVANFLRMLRSVSDKGNKTASQPEWKVKQDNEEFRVMYREGPVGVPFHTLMVEGYVDGPMDICMCISVEVDLYAKWWPQSTIPTFKILSCKCLQKISNGEQLALVRVKVSWPLSTREAIVHFFMFEYLEDDLLVVLFNTVSESETIDISTHGFTNEAIPEAKDVVRIDMVGGFALQKVTEERSYFRTIANMDIKLDFVPPSLINFMSRQLIGNGFKLFQKAVTSRFTDDEDFRNALKGSLYARLREDLYSTKQSNGFLEEKPELESKISDTHEEELETSQNLVISVPEEEHEASNNVEIEVQKTSCEIEELKSDEEEERESKQFDGSKETEVMTPVSVSRKRNGTISLEVEQALGTLEKVISMVRQYGFNPQLQSSFDFIANKRASKDNNADNDDSKSLQVKIDSVSDVEADAMKSSLESPRNSSSITNSRQGGSNSFSKEVNHNKIAPISLEQKLSLVHCDTNMNEVDFFPSENSLPILNHNMQTNDKYSNNNGGKNPGQEKRHRFCCFGFIS